MNKAGLTAREIEIVRLLVVECLFDKEVAGRLGISVDAVGTRRNRIYKKLGLHSGMELARWAIRAGVVRVEDFLTAQTKFPSAKLNIGDQADVYHAGTKTYYRALIQKVLTERMVEAPEME